MSQLISKRGITVWLVASALFIAVWRWAAPDASAADWIFSVTLIVLLAGLGTSAGLNARAHRARSKS